MPAPSDDANLSRITDPARIRAMAHPVRLELIDYLHDVGEATATECAAHTGESVANCSFHLRLLAKYGFIERGEQRGREKPWRPVRRGWEMRPDPDIPGSLHAVVEIAGLHLHREAERFRQFLAQAQREDDEWVQAITLTSSDFWATTAEMADLSRELQQITERFADRRDNPTLRPPGARRGRMFAAVNPEPLESDGGSSEG